MDSCYGSDLIDELLEYFIIAVEALLDILCPHCHKRTVHKMFRENPDSSYDEIGLKCMTCNKIL